MAVRSYQESIRQWYKETNEQLPLHHRLFITNEAPEKLGGLQKTKHVSNGSKIWRKNSSKNYTQQIQILNIQNKRSVHYVKLANQIVRKDSVESIEGS